jgi:hypothetical protein
MQLRSSRVADEGFTMQWLTIHSNNHWLWVSVSSAILQHC